MKTFKRFSAFITAVLMLISFAGCTGTGENETTSVTESTTSYIREVKTKIASLSGPLGIGIAKLCADRDYAYDSTVYNDAAEITELLKNGGADIAVLPVNTAAALFNETEGAIKFLAVNNSAVFHIIENGKEIKSIDDLKGKKIYTLGEGSMPEFLLGYILSENGLDGKVTVEYKADFEEIKALADDGTAAVIMLPEPYAAMLVSGTEGMRYALDLADEWKKICDTPFAQSVIVARTEYIEQNPAYIDSFLMQNEISLNFLIENPMAAPDLLTKAGSFSSPELVNAALAGCNPLFMKGESMKNAVSAVLEMLYNANPESIGGKLPDDAVYFGC